MEYKPVCTLHASTIYFIHVLAVTLAAQCACLESVFSEDEQPSLLGLHAARF